MSVIFPLSKLNNTTISVHELGLGSFLCGFFFLVEALAPVPELSDGGFLVMDLAFSTFVSRMAVFAHEALARDAKRIHFNIRVV